LEAGYFTVNGRKSEDINLFIEDRPDIQTPKRRVSFVSPVSYEGELVYDDDGYEPTEFELKCFYDGSSHGDDFAKLSEARNNINSLFGHGKGEWMSFVPYFDEEHSYQIIMMEIKFENKSYYEGCMSVTIKLKCQPYKYLITNEVEISSNYVLNNPTGYTAKPVFIIAGARGEFVLTTNKTIIRFKGLYNETLYVDSNTYNVFGQETTGGISNWNDRTIGKEFPLFIPGKNTIIFDKPQGDHSSIVPGTIHVRPNWRVLV
jgi:hypothetical protein